MAGIFSEKETIALWLKVEIELARTQAKLGLISEAAAASIRNAAVQENINNEILWNQASNIGYPILPLVRMIAHSTTSEGAGRVHYGATTQDIMDTALAMQLKMAGECLQRRLDSFGDSLSILIKNHRLTIMAGRTHAQQAVPTTFGVKIAIYIDELSRQYQWICRATKQVGVLSLFGAAGTSASYGSAAAVIREVLSQELGLTHTDVPWHVARDRLIYFGLAATSLCGSLSRFAREIIDLSRTEIGEVSEPSGHHRGASSTMPQKSNPIWCEAIIGLTSTATSLSSALLRSMEGGHERAAGEWQIEWQVLPQVCNLTSTALGLANQIAMDLQVDTERMKFNLTLDSGNLMAEAYMMKLSIAMGREDAHDLVYKATRLCKSKGIQLYEALFEITPEPLRPLIAGIEPQNYLGDAEKICDRALLEWAERRNLST